MTHRHLITAIAIIFLITCSVLPVRAGTRGELEVGLEQATELVDRGSVAIAVTTSRDDSPGGPHNIDRRHVATLAWPEGLATYFAQSILGDSLYVNRDPNGGWKKRVDDLSRIPRGTENNQEDGDLCEWPVGAFLWDLDDPRNLGEGDHLTSWWPRTYSILRTLKNTSDLDRGITGKADLADFVRHAARTFSGSKGNMHILLHNRYYIDWLSDPAFTQ